MNSSNRFFTWMSMFREDNIHYCSLKFWRKEDLSESLEGGEVFEARVGEKRAWRWLNLIPKQSIRVRFWRRLKYNRGTLVPVKLENNRCKLKKKVVHLEKLLSSSIREGKILRLLCKKKIHPAITGQSLNNRSAHLEQKTETSLGCILTYF